jgi:glycosyltransferase involved in cell wall biosynthesis
MKILFIASTRIPTERAMGTAIMKQCEAFAKKGIEVELIVPTRHNVHTDNPFAYHDVEQNFLIQYLWALDVSFLGKMKLRFMIQKVTFFVSLLWYVYTSNAEILYTREPELVGFIHTKKKKIIELHHMYGLRLFGKKYLTSCTGIITITHALKEDVVNAYEIQPECIHVVPSGVAVSVFAQHVSKVYAQESLGVHTEKPIALYIGSLEEWKGYVTFLETEEFLKNAVQLMVIGGADAHVQSLRMQYPQVIFLGTLPQRNLSINQRIADVLVVPNSAREVISARHTSPLKVLAHMASGIPIVASATVSIGELLSFKNAILVEPDNAQFLAEGILRAITDTNHASIITEQAMQDVLQYDWNVRTESILHFISKQAK